MESETEKESKNENGKVYDKMFRREIELSDDESVTVIIDQAVEGDTGVVVWDAAIVLAKYLQASGGVSGRRVLELGSGTGAVGLAAAALGASPVTLTDLPPLMELLQHNIHINRPLVSSTSTFPLVWGDRDQGEELLSHLGGPPDLLLVSDCVFYPDSVPPLVASLTQLCGPSTELLLSYEERESQEKLDTVKLFFRLMSASFEWSKTPLSSHHPEFRSEDIQIFRFAVKKIVEVES